MKRERCPRCGGRLEVEGESWRRDSRAVERLFHCESCGARFGSSFAWPHAWAPSERVRGRSTWAVALAWVSVALVALWLALRALDYGTARVAVYSAVSRAAEAFLHPAWVVALSILAVLLFLASRRRATPIQIAPSVAPAVQLRAEPPGKISVVIAGSRDAVAHDTVVPRDREAERQIVESFQALARRTVAFGPEGETSPGREEIEGAQRELYALGLRIGETLLGGPGGVGESLLDLPGDHLQLGIQGEISDIPWELLVARRGGRFLWQLFSVTRQLRDEVPAGRARTVGRGPRRMLLLANLESGSPGRELPAAEREAAEILELGAAGQGILKVVRKSPRTAAELGRLLAEGFDIVHFAGHTDETEGAGRGWTLGDGETVSPAELLGEAASPPGIVFANACSTGTDLRPGDVAGAARALMLAGVPAYLCTLAELHDSGSAAFSTAFYGALLRGATLGGALTAARNALMGRHPFTWANYVLYGDPAVTLR